MPIDDSIRSQIDLAAIIFGAGRSSFSAREFTEFLNMAAITIEEEETGEILLELASCRAMREIGPGVYAIIPDTGAGVPIEHPVYQDDAPDNGAAVGGPRIGGQP